MNFTLVGMGGFAKGGRRGVLRGKVGPAKEARGVRPAVCLAGPGSVRGSKSTDSGLIRGVFFFFSQNSFSFGSL